MGTKIFTGRPWPRRTSGRWLHCRLGGIRVDRGATAAEYALMVSLIVVVIAAAVATFGENVSALFIVPAGTF